MPGASDDFDVLISGLLDGELPPEERDRLLRQIEASEELRVRYESLRRLTVGTAAALAAPPPPPERWAQFTDEVYNRLERRVGWGIFVVGAVALAAYAIFLFLTEPWAGMLVKLLVATPLVGLCVLFVSVLRERLAALKHDRYSREVHR